MAKNKYIETPDILWELFSEYKKEVKSNPRTKHVFVGKDAVSEREELERQQNLELVKLEEEKQAKIKEIKKKQADIDFAITVANIIASTAKAVAENLANPAIAVLVGALGLVQIGIANAQRKTVQALARGGMVYGPGTETSDSIPVMLSNGESVINAKATKRFAPLLSAINQSVGGDPIVPKFAAGGIVTANPGQVTISNIDDIAAVAGQSAVRAYILDADVTSQSAKNARIQRLSRIK